LGIGQIATEVFSNVKIRVKLFQLVQTLHRPDLKSAITPVCFWWLTIQEGKAMNNGISPDLTNNDRREAMEGIDRPQGYKGNGRGRADEAYSRQASVDPRSVVARQFRLMSEVHDRIRMKVLAAGQAGAR